MPKPSNMTRMAEAVLSLCKPDFYYEGTLDLLTKITYDNSFTVEQFDEIKECMVTKDPEVLRQNYNQSQVEKIQQWRNDIVKEYKNSLIVEDD